MITINQNVKKLFSNEEVEKMIDVINSEIDHLSKNFIVKDVEVVWMSKANGIAGSDVIQIHPDNDEDRLRWMVSHEVGHHNVNDLDNFDIWEGKSELDKLFESQDLSEVEMTLGKYATTNASEWFAEKFASENSTSKLNKYYS